MTKLIKKDGWTLVHASSGAGVAPGAYLPDFRGDRQTIMDGDPPHKPSSTGRVYTKDGNSYYPGVFNLKWRPDNVQS